MQLLEIGAGLDPELLDERAPSVLVGVQCFRLSAGAIERKHQMRAEPLPNRILADQGL